MHFELYIPSVFTSQKSVSAFSMPICKSYDLMHTLYSNVWHFRVHPIVLRFILNDLREITFSHSFIHYNILAKQLTYLWFLVGSVD